MLDRTVLFKFLSDFFWFFNGIVHFGPKFGGWRTDWFGIFRFSASRRSIFWGIEWLKNDKLHFKKLKKWRKLLDAGVKSQFLSISKFTWIWLLKQRDFCEKCDFENAIFVKKNWLVKCDFCKKCDFERCDFYEKWVSEMWLFVKYAILKLWFLWKKWL